MMALKFILVFLCQCVGLVALAAAPVVQEWDNMVYTGRHFNSLIVNSTQIDDHINDNIVKTSGLLIIYDSTCLDKLQQEHMVVSRLPPARHLVFAKYNYKMAESRVWYDMDEDDDLRDRYGFVECPDVMYLPKGGPVDLPVPWIQGETFLEWIWRQFMIKLQIKNDLLDAVTVAIDGNGPSIEKVTLQSGAYIKTHTYVSYTIVVKTASDDKVAFCTVINEKMPRTIEIDINNITKSKFFDTDENEWRKKVDAKLQQQNEEITKRRKELASLYALGLKLPLLIPKFSDTGYDVRDFSREKFFHRFSAYYNNAGKSYTSLNLEPLFNTDDAPIKHIEVREDILIDLTKELKPILEEWASCEIQFTSSSGIYLLSHGAYIRPHNGNLDEEVLSVLLMLERDADEWDLEVLDYSGERAQVAFSPGRALLYESATVSHNSRISFNGYRAALVYLHFKPSGQWKWSRKGEMVTNGQITDNIFKLDTPVTRRENWKNNIFTKWSEKTQEQDIHDEL